MKETPRVVTRTRRVESSRGWPARICLYRGAGAPGRVSEVAARLPPAPGKFSKHPLPTPQEEAWRRTDIRALRAECLPPAGADAYLDLPVRARLRCCEPLVGEEHGGQVILMPGGVENTFLDPEIAAKGVIFTDLRPLKRAS
jgi:hypothetical protein